MITSSLSTSRFSTISVVMGIVFSSALLVTLGLASFYQFKVTSLRAEAITQQENRAKEITVKLETYLTNFQQLAQSTAALVTPLRQDKQTVEIILQRMLTSASQETVYGIGAWFEPYKFAGTLQRFGPYVHRGEKSHDPPVLTYEWDTPEYNYYTQPWYLLGKKGHGSTMFTEPYFDTNLVYMSATQAFFDENKEFAGVVTVDMVLPLLRDFVTKANVTEGEMVYVTTAQGAIFVHPREQALLDFARQRGQNVTTVLDLQEKDLQEFNATFNATAHYIETSVKVNYTDWTVHISSNETLLFYEIIELRNNLFSIISILWLSVIIIEFALMRVAYTTTRSKQKQVLLESELVERKHVEEILQKNNELLEHKVQERTAELLAAKAAAEMANHAKSRFLASMSHELRTPLNGILGYTQILRRDKTLTTKQADGLNIIQQSGEHLLNLITDILDMSKIEAGKLELTAAPVQLATFLDGIMNMIQLRIQSKDIQFIYEPLCDLEVYVEVDEKRLRQILLNLLNNAVKFTDNGQVIFRISSHNELKSRDNLRPSLKLRFEIIDTGVGMTADQLEQIFNPFVQVGDAKKRTEGTGLGLAITYQLVEAMGSLLQVNSEPGQGSTFWFELGLPLTEATPMAETEHMIKGYTGSRRRILVVDDKSSNRAILVNMLEPLGFELYVAENGQQAVDQVQSVQPDLVLMDMIMPIMTGFEATQAIRQMTNLQPIVIIGASASAFGQDIQRVKLAGCDTFLPKPIDFKKLLQVLEEFLNLTWVYEQNMTLPSTPEPTSPPNEAVMILPPVAELNQLLNFAMLGDLRAVRNQLTALEQSGQNYKPFTDKLQGLAKAYEDKQIVALLKVYLES